MGFSAAGFFGKLNDNIDDQRSYVRARVDEDRKYLRGEGLKRQAAIQKQRGTYEKVANDLIRRGADKRTVLGTLEMDPQGLLAVADRVNSDRNITTAGINSLFAVHDEYKGEATMEEILNKILPTIQKMPEGTDPVQAKKKSLGAFLGLDLEAELDNEVYGSHIVGGQTGDQIMTSMGLPVSASGTGGGVEYNLERTSSMSYGQAKPMIDLALSDYGPEWEATELKRLDAASAAEGITTDELAAISEERAFIEAGKGMTPAKRMEHRASRYGLGPQAEELYNKYGTTLFNVEFGFPSSLVDLMAGGISQEAEEPVEEKPTEPEATAPTPMEVEEAAKSEAEALFKADPTKDSVDVTLLTGETITIPRSEIAKEGVPEETGEDTTSPIGKAFVSQLNLVAEEAAWLVTAVSSKFNEQLGDIASAFYKPAGETLTAAGKKQAVTAEAILEKGLEEVLDEFYREHPEKKPLAAKIKKTLVKSTMKSLADDAKAGRGFGRSNYSSDGTEPKLGY
jgi:hypothetical protein